MLLVRPLVNSRLLVIKFLVSQKLYVDFQLREGAGNPNPHVAQRSTRSTVDIYGVYPRAELETLGGPCKKQF